jgi:hypothetical protein
VLITLRIFRRIHFESAWDRVTETVQNCGVRARLTRDLNSLGFLLAHCRSRVLIPSAASLFPVYEAFDVSVTPTREPITLATLISERCRALGLSQAEFVSRVGCRDIQRGIRRLHELFDADHTRTKALIEAISAALDLPDSVVYRAAQVSQLLFADRRRRHLEVEEATLPVFMRCPTVSRQKKSPGAIVPYLRLISS